MKLYPNRMVNLSTNTWIFIPGVAYTKILPEVNIELTGIWQMEFDTGAGYVVSERLST